MGNTEQIIKDELFLNAKGLSECEADCYGLTGSKFNRCVRECQSGSVEKSTSGGGGNLAGILSGFAELVNAGGGIYATHIASKGGSYIPNYNYDTNTMGGAGYPMMDDEEKRKRNRNTVLIGVGILAVIGVAGYFLLKKD